MSLPLDNWSFVKRSTEVDTAGGSYFPPNRIVMPAITVRGYPGVA